MAEVNFQPSLKVESFFSENLANNSERFLLFLKAYYEWLQTTKITYTNLSGTFQRDEEIIGATSGASGIVKEVGTGYLVINLTSRFPFDKYETFTGQTSSATAVTNTIKNNVIRSSGDLLNNRYIETSVDTYLSYLKEELYPSIPETVYGNKRLLAAKFKNYFESKSNEQSYRFLFKLLYDEEIEFYYPGEDLLRVSDGNFEKTRVIRVAVIADVFDFLEKTIRGETSGALANVVDIKTFFIGSFEIAEFTLTLVSGTFETGESIVDIANEDLTTTVYGIVSGFTINDGGSGYEVGDEVVLSGDGSEAQAFVSSVSDASITTLKVNTTGHGYRLNTNAIVNNSGTGGNNLIVRVTELANTYTVTSGVDTYTVGEVATVSIINRGSGYVKKPTITLEDTSISTLGLLSAELITVANGGIDYGVGNTLVFTGGSGANAAGQVAAVEESTTYDFLFEDGFRMLSEDSYYDIIKNEDWEVVGPIARVELTNFGDGYETANLPSITVTTTTGSGANLVATNIQGKSANVEVDVANNLIGVGAIRAIEITNFGIDYTSATANTSASGDGNANVSVTISGLGIKEGNWIDDDGKIDYKIIQDSFFYQDFSYVIQSGLAFSFYRDTIKELIHPAGLQPFGQILISSFIDVAPEFRSQIAAVTEAVNEILISLFNSIDVSPNIGSLNTYEVKLPYSSSNVAFVEANYEVLWGQLRVLNPDLFGVPVSNVGGVTFLDHHSSGTTLRNIEIEGTVTISGNTVIGTNTSFDYELLPNDFLIVDNAEKFIIQSIANSEFLTINVPATGTYTNSTAYREAK